MYKVQLDQTQRLAYVLRQDTDGFHHVIATFNFDTMRDEPAIENARLFIRALQLADAGAPIGEEL